MRDYGIVSPQFWIGATGKSLRGCPEAQVLALYLMTSPHANMIGVFHCPVLYMAHETGLGIEGASKALARLIEAEFCRYDETTEEVFVVRMAAYQIGETLDPKDKRCIGVARELEKVSSEQLRIGFRARFSVAFNLPNSYIKPAPTTSPIEAPSKPLRSQDQDQEHEQDTSVDKSTDGKPSPRSPSEKSKTELWRGAVSLLSEQGMPEPQARTFIGKLSKDYPSDDIVLTAVQGAVSEQPADARAYLKATCQRLAGERNRDGNRVAPAWEGAK